MKASEQGKAKSVYHDWKKWAVVAFISATTLAFHYGFMGEGLRYGDLFRRLCYLPILLGALWFGLVGGLGTASVISLAVVPHMSMVARMGGDLSGEFVEVFFYILLGGLFGVLAQREWRIERARQESERRLARAEHFSSIGQMASHLAHEIKNPLGSILGAAEIIIPAIPENDPKREFGNILVAEVDRLNRVVSDFLKYARPVELKLERISLNDLISGVATQMRISSGNNVKVPWNPNGDVFVTADPEKLRQVLLNLSLNAIRAMPKGGVVEFDVKSYKENGATIAVTDTGHGISPENLKRIFNPFFTTEPGGAGLGLAISERIIAEHGGTIEVESAPGHGSRFVITLPQKEVSQP